MSFDIFWSAQAELSYLEILEYLQEKWTEKEVRNFITRTDDILDLIKTKSCSFSTFKRKQL